MILLKWVTFIVIRVYNILQCFRTATVAVYAIKAHRVGGGTAPPIPNQHYIAVCDQLKSTATLCLRKVTEHEHRWSPNLTWTSWKRGKTLLTDGNQTLCCPAHGPSLNQVSHSGCLYHCTCSVDRWLMMLNQILQNCFLFTSTETMYVNSLWEQSSYNTAWVNVHADWLDSTQEKLVSGLTLRIMPSLD